MEYKKYKIRLLKQLMISVTKEMKEHLKILNSEIAIDNYVHDLIMRYL